MFFIDNKFKKLIKLLPLAKPLVIFDIETTGLSIMNDKIIEIAYTKIWQNGTVKEADIFFNPEMKISPAASAVHGILDENVKDKLKFRDKAQELWEIFNNSYYAGFKIKIFDLPLLRREFIRTGMDFDYQAEDIVDVREIFSYMSPRTLSSAYEYYCGKQLKLGHTAPLNTRAAAEILLKQLEKYKEIRDWEFIKQISHHEEEDFPGGVRHFYWRRGAAYFGFSKYKDKPLAQIVKEDPQFLQWILSTEFPEEIKNIIRAALEDKHVKK